MKNRQLLKKLLEILTCSCLGVGFVGFLLVIFGVYTDQIAIGGIGPFAYLLMFAGFSLFLIFGFTYMVLSISKYFDPKKEF